MNDLNKVIVTDLEMSGLNPSQNGILSIGAVPLIGEGEFYLELCLDSTQDCVPEALKVNGFTLDQAYDVSKPSQKEGVKTFYSWAEDMKPQRNYETAIIGGHNIHCDAGFLRSVRNSWPFRYRLMDTHSIALALTGKSMSSEEMVKYLGVEPEPKIHNALEGAKMAKRCLVALFGLTNKSN